MPSNADFDLRKPEFCSHAKVYVMGKETDPQFPKDS